MLMRDPYAVLGVKRDAGPDEIKAAWRTVAKTVHPDQNQDDPFATVRFTEVGRAYDLLRDPDKRSRYDRAHRDAEIRREMELRRMEQMHRQQSARKAQAEAEKAQAAQASQAAQTSQAASESAEDMVSRIFGVDARQQAASGQPASARTAHAGHTSSAATAGAADRTAGFKAQPDHAFDDAESRAASTRRSVAATDIITGLLRRIRGSRPAVDKAPDLACDLTVSVGDLLKQARAPLEVNGETLKVHLSAGTTEGTAIRLREQGHRINDLKRGDVVVTVRVSPGAFRVDGLDLRTTLPVTIENAVLGCETTIDGPEGEKLSVTIPAWTSSDHAIRLEGQGLFDAAGKRGDLLVDIRLLLWERPDDKMIDLMRSLREGLYL